MLSTYINTNRETSAKVILQTKLHNLASAIISNKILTKS